MGAQGTASRHLTHTQVAAALTEAKGLVTVAATLLKCSRQTVQRHIQQSPVCRQALEDARELTLDLAEMALYKQVNAGEGWAVCFILKCLGKSRGYIERTELAGAPDAPLVFTLRWPEEGITRVSEPEALPDGYGLRAVPD